MSSIARILDANRNRAAEALRMMEDAARFDRHDQATCAALKSLRHDLRIALATLPEGWLEAHRDSAADVGTTISTTSEMVRESLLDVVVAAGKRLTESLRVMEELLKTIDADAAARVEAVRYRAYDVDANLQRLFGSGKARQWTLCLLLTRSICRQPWKQVLRGALDNGCDCIQVREKEMAGGELLCHTREVIEIARKHGASVIVNDRVDVAAIAGADGVHLGQADLSVHDARKLAGRALIVGVSTHNMTEARAAANAGADYCGVGMMFSSALKPELNASGPAYLREFLEQYSPARLPHLAIGGIDSANVGTLAAIGCRGVAVSTAICAAENPATATKSIADQLSPSAVALHI